MANYNNFDLKIIASSGVYFEGLVQSLSFNDEQGQMMILANFNTSIGLVKKGKVSVLTYDNKKRDLYVKDGFYKVKNNKCILMISDCSSTPFDFSNDNDSAVEQKRKMIRKSLKI